MLKFVALSILACAAATAGAQTTDTVKVHANGEHPAVLVSHKTPAGIDANRFLVQPPASTTWTVSESAPVLTVAAAAVLR